MSRTGRYAPSPTGRLHLGNLRTAMLAWLFARSTASKFYLRIDDLDPDRSRAKYVHEQLADLQAIGLDWDGEPLVQSERSGQYDGAIEQLIATGATYPCFCTRAEIRNAASAPHSNDGLYPGTCAQLSDESLSSRAAAGEPHCLRVHARAITVSFEDELLGHVSSVVDDFVIRRKDGVAAYNLATVVDDAAQHVQLVVRGADLADSTPRQLWLAQQLNIVAPDHAHVPLMLGKDGSRLAKRHGSVTLADWIHDGKTADDVRSHLAHSLGMATTTEDVSMETLLSRFDPTDLSATPTVC